MISPLEKKFNELTESKFAYIKLTKIDVFLNSQTIELFFIYPIDRSSEVRENEHEIKSAILSALKSKASVKINLKGAVFDLEYCRKLLTGFMAEYPSIAPFIVENVINSDVKENGEIDLNITLDSDMCAYCRLRKVDIEIEKFLQMHFTEKIKVKFLEQNADAMQSEIENIDDNAPRYYMSMSGGRQIVPTDRELIFGKEITENALYIEDCTHVKADQTIVICGTVDGFSELQKSDGTKTFYKFVLTDFTGSMTCLVFENKSLTADKIKLIKNQRQIIIRGQLKEKEFRGEKNYSVFVKSASFCKLPENFVKNEIIRQTPTAYSLIFPTDYIITEQSDFFGATQSQDVPPYCIGKTFVIYDFETTGLDTRICKITEIGAVKIVDGRIRQTFTSLINPEESLDLRIVEKTHITDEMLMDQPKIEEVLPDFNLFCSGAILIGHNSNEFDYKILTRVASEQKLKFSDEHDDTLVISKKYLHDVRNYKLSTLAKYYDIVNENAHRALDDALTTAKIFLNLAKYM